jgi:predicted Zn-dependent protease
LLGINPSIAGITGYSRELETEADAVGLKMMAAAGYDPTAALRLFEHLQEEIELTGVQESFFFGTHPSVETRIKNIETLLMELNDPQAACVRNRSEFMSKIRGLIADNARLDLMQGRFLMASRGVIKCLAIDSQDARVHYLLGEIYYQSGRKEDLSKAIACFESALLIDPAYVDPHKAIGMIRFKAGQFESARKHFESCLSLSPDYPDKPYIQQYIKKCELRDEG